MAQKRILCGLLLLAIPLGGCGTGDGYSQYFDIISQSVRSIGTVQRVSRNTAANIPYATLGYRLGGGSEALLVLATEAGDDLIWTSSSHVTFRTVSGRVHRTVGLEHDLTGLNASGANTLTPPGAALKGAFSSRRIQDFADINAYSIAVSCTAVARGLQSVTIIGTRIPTRRIEETCTAPTLKWRFTDTFWVDPETGFVWRSLQHIHPKMDVIDLEILRPPG